LPGGEAALVGLAALVVVFLPFLWPLVEHFNAMAHEGAHAVVGSPMGFGIKGVTLSIETPRRNSSRPGTLLPCYGSQSCSSCCCCSWSANPLPLSLFRPSSRCWVSRRR